MDHSYPVQVRARLDEPLAVAGQGLLAILNYIVLSFLWLAFAAATVIALFAILLTARYPRPLFGFNLLRNQLGFVHVLTGDYPAAAASQQQAQRCSATSVTCPARPMPLPSSASFSKKPATTRSSPPHSRHTFSFLLRARRDQGGPICQ